MPLSPVVTPSHDGAVHAVRELLLDKEPSLRRRFEQVFKDGVNPP